MLSASINEQCALRRPGKTFHTNQKIPLYFFIFSTLQNWKNVRAFICYPKTLTFYNCPIQFTLCLAALRNIKLSIKIRDTYRNPLTLCMVIMDFLAKF